MKIQDLANKPLYVCGTCGQDFSRRSNANRHNQNLHSNQAEIVRVLEYLLGRICGKYLPGDPLSYRTSKIFNNKFSVVHESRNYKNLQDEKSRLFYDKSPDYTQGPKENGIYRGDIKNSDLEHRANTGFQPSEKERKEKLLRRNIEELIGHRKKAL